jgi:hypothetical protein
MEYELSSGIILFGGGALFLLFVLNSVVSFCLHWLLMPITVMFFVWILDHSSSSWTAQMVVFVIIGQ